MIRVFYDIEKEYVWRIEPHYTCVFWGGDLIVLSDSHIKKGEKLTVSQNNGGYLYYKINNKRLFVHTIIAEKFLGKRKAGLVINHKDGVKSNNAPTNLEYVTIAENIKHAIDNGLHVCCDPTKMPTYKDGRCKDRNKYKLAWYHKNKKLKTKTSVSA